MNIHGFNIKLSYESSLWTASLKMAAERYLSRRIPDLRVGNNIDEIDKKLIPASIHPCFIVCLYKAKGDALDKGNYRGLKLTEQAMKVLERIVDGLIRQVVSIAPPSLALYQEEALQMQSLWSGSCKRNT